jgi:tetratricopeptide (TPR) repeat protein
MIRNGFTDPVGDLWWGTAGQISGPSQFIDSTALPNNTFVAFDRRRGRMFAYDSQGQLLYVWGGFGNREGFFMIPTAIESMGFTIFALDGGENAALTRFDLTEYGHTINSALYTYQRGQYDQSYFYWNEVLRMNGNFGLAYIGLARALLRQGYYREAMDYFRLQNDQRNFGRAFGFHRRVLMEEWFWLVAVAVGILMIVPPIVKRIRKVRREIREA